MNSQQKHEMRERRRLAKMYRRRMNALNRSANLLWRTTLESLAPAFAAAAEAMSKFSVAFPRK